MLMFSASAFASAFITAFADMMLRFLDVQQDTPILLPIFVVSFLSIFVVLHRRRLIRF